MNVVIWSVLVQRLLSSIVCKNLQVLQGRGTNPLDLAELAGDYLSYLLFSVGFCYLFVGVGLYFGLYFVIVNLNIKHIEEYSYIFLVRIKCCGSCILGVSSLVLSFFLSIFSLHLVFYPVYNFILFPISRHSICFLRSLREVPKVGCLACLVACRNINTIDAFQWSLW